MEKLVIKKYSNRRLYSSEESRCITLEELGETIKKGREVQVMDSKTNEDVTPFILIQVLTERSKKNVFLPASFLHLLIRYGDNLLSEFFEDYFEQVLRTYLNYKSTMDQQFKNWLELGANFSRETSKNMLQTNPFSAFGLFGKSAPASGPAQGTGPDEAKAPAEETDPGREKTKKQ